MAAENSAPLNYIIIGLHVLTHFLVTKLAILSEL